MNLSSDFINLIKPFLGSSYDEFEEALRGGAPTSFRFNSGKIAQSVDGDVVPWCQSGRYLSERPSFTFDPLFHAGCYYVQEASSMFIGTVLEQYLKSSVRVLDLCAAPGGKSTLIADLIDDNSFLVSNEVIRSRANILSENITKWGKPNTIVTNNDPSQFAKLKSFFDIILVDAPCSGEGMFRKDEGAVEEWSLANVKLCKERQQRIVADVWPALKEDGILIYSTCTYNEEENEENIKWIRDELDAEVLSVDINQSWGITESQVEGIPAYRFFPHRTKGEGFFCAVLRKKGNEEGSFKFKDKSKKTTKNRLDLQYQDYVLNNESFTFYENNNKWFAFPSTLYNDLLSVRSQLNVVSEGICLGEFKGKDFIPDQSLALSTYLNANSFVSHDLDWQTAISYLRKEILVLENLPKGYILLTYKDTPLGFVKNLGSRANNLYPQEWRIRSSNIPQEQNIISFKK